MLNEKCIIPENYLLLSWHYERNLLEKGINDRDILYLYHFKI